MKKCISLILALVIAFSVAIPVTAKSDEKNYSYVLVHGLGGWGESSAINKLSPYWGSKTGNLAEYLTAQGYNTVEASVGPFSSTWDRTCELYAQLTGTTVDYGEAHSKEHKHDRYGTTYAKAIVDNWNENYPVNLIGHSFGGETVRLLASLMAYGSSDEIAATGANTSGLFTGHKADWVHSVVTLCSPHNGSTLYYSLNAVPGLVKSILGFAKLISNVADATGLNKFYNVELKQFELLIFANGTDNAGYELSPEGAAELNKQIKTVDSVYYFSYSFSYTHKVGNSFLPNNDILPVLYLPALLIGTYNDTRFDRENDGLVNVNSALYPWTEPYKAFDENCIEQGVWNVMPTMKGHHGTIIGMDENTEEIHSFYNELFEMLQTADRR